MPRYNVFVQWSSILCLSAEIVIISTCWTFNYGDGKVTTLRQPRLTRILLAFYCSTFMLRKFEIICSHLLNRFEDGKYATIEKVRRIKMPLKIPRIVGGVLKWTD